MAQQLINGKQQFIDGNGNPLAGGSVAFYQPGTLTPVNTYQDPGLTTPNANPVVLDANGMGTIWGALETQYRQVVTNALGVQLWDQVVGTIGTAATQSVQSGSYNTAPDAGSANAYSMTLSPAPVALTPGMIVTLQSIKATNTAESTLNVNGTGALPIQAAAGGALQGNELSAGFDAVFELNAGKNAWNLIATTGGSLPINGGYKSNQAVNYGQFSSTLTGNGYQTLPNGFMIQWGIIVSQPTNTTATNPFNVAFPNTCFSMQATFGAAIVGGYTYAVGVAPINRSQFSSVVVSSVASGSLGFNWYAVGN